MISVINSTWEGGGLYDHLKSTKILIFDNVENIHTNPQNHDESGYNLDLDMLTIFVLIACFMSYKKWAS